MKIAVTKPYLVVYSCLFLSFLFFRAAFRFVFGRERNDFLNLLKTFYLRSRFCPIFAPLSLLHFSCSIFRAVRAVITTVKADPYQRKTNLSRLQITVSLHCCGLDYQPLFVKGARAPPPEPSSSWGGM